MPAKHNATTTGRRTPAGTSAAARLDEEIYHVVRQIPRGRVAAYGWVAERAGLVRGARRVGRALALLSPSSRVPWHRVVNAQGRLSFPPGSTAAARQRKLLTAEGIRFTGQRIDLKRQGWQRSLDEWLWRPD